MATSTLPAVKAALVDLLRARRELERVQVSYGDPGVAKVEREAVFLAGTKDSTQSWAGQGGISKNETYVLLGYVNVSSKGLTQQQATERAYALFGVVEDTVRPLARQPWGAGDGVWSAAVQPTDLTEYVSDEGYAALVTFEIEIKARI